MTRSDTTHRRPRKSAVFTAGAALALSLTAGLPAGAADPVTATSFTYTGAPQTWTVPEGVCRVVVDAFGAQGGAGEGNPAIMMGSQGETHGYFALPEPGGKGARVTATISVTPGSQVEVRVGGAGDGGQNPDREVPADPTGTHPGTGGWNGGGHGGQAAPGTNRAGGGGGATDVRVGGSSLTDRVVVAAGGGGSGAGSGVGSPDFGDGSGGDSSAAGKPGAFTIQSLVTPASAEPESLGQGAQPGGPATATEGGPGGIGAVWQRSEGSPGLDGSLGTGGAGAASTSSTGENDYLGGFVGGGGGGGLYGGGGGGAATGDPSRLDISEGSAPFLTAGGGGGGSSLGTTVQEGVAEGDGHLTLTPIAGSCPAAPQTPAAPTAAPAVAVAHQPDYTG